MGVNTICCMGVLSQWIAPGETWPIVTRIVIITSRNGAFWIWLTYIGLPRKQIIWVQKTFGMIHSNTNKKQFREYFMSTSNSSKLLRWAPLQNIRNMSRMNRYILRRMNPFLDLVVTFAVQLLIIVLLGLLKNWNMDHFFHMIWYLSFFAAKNQLRPSLWRYLDHLHGLLQTHAVDFLAIPLKIYTCIALIRIFNQNKRWSAVVVFLR